MFRAIINGANGTWKTAKRAVIGLGSFIQNITRTVARYNKENFVSAYGQGVKQTMPQSFHVHETNNTPPKQVIRRLADILLFPVFSSVPGWITGFFLAPFIYATYKNTASFFQLPIDLVYYDRKKKINLAWQGGLYGLLGAITGFVFGSIAAFFAFTWRVAEQTWHTTASVITQLINWSVSDLHKNNVVLEPKIAVKEYHHADRTPFEKTLGRYIGSPIYVAAGVIVLSTISVGRFIVNTALSSWRGFARGINFAVSDMMRFSQISNDPNGQALNGETYTLIPTKMEYRNEYQRYFFGALGTLFVGPSLTIVGFTAVATIRLLGNSIYSFIRVTAKTARVFLQDTAADNLFDVGNDPRDSLSYGYSKSLGYPGKYILGIPAIALGTGVGMSTRFIIETYISFINTARLTLNLALQNTPSYHPFRPLKSQRANYERTIGSLGYFLGVILPSPMTLSIVLARTLMTNLITAKNFTQFFLKEHSTLHGAIEVSVVNDDEETIHFSDNLDNHVIQPPNVAINVASQKSILTRLMSWLKKVNSANDADQRPIWLQVLSSPGIVIGSLLGGGLRAMVETTLTSIDTVIAMLNLALYKSKFANQFNPIKPDRNTLERTLGVFGYIIGGAFGVTPLLTIGFTRWVITNGDSANRAFTLTVNSILANDDPLRLEEQEADTRPNVVKASSILGYMVGSLLGISREFGLNTIRSFGRQINYYGKAALFESSLDDKITNLSEDTRTPGQKRLGYFGLFSGTGLGLIAYGSITFVRIAGNSIISAYHTTRDMIEMAFLEDYPTSDTFTETRRIKAFRATPTIPSRLNGIDERAEFGNGSDDEEGELLPIAQPVNSNDNVHPLTREDHRKNRPFLLGAPGLIIGGMIGTGAFTLASFGRILLNSAITTWNTTLDFTDNILPEGASTQNVRAPQNKPVSRLMGYPIGKLLGIFVTGPLAWSAVFLYRLTANTAITSFLVAEIITTLPPIKNTIKGYHDLRGTVDKRFGLAGFVFGGFALSIAFGTLGYVVNIAWHTVYHSAISGFRAFMYPVYWSMGSRKHHLLVGVNQNEFETSFAKDERTPFERYGFGFIGSLLGPILSAPVSIMIATTRLALLNGKLFLIGFMRAANLTLEKPFTARQMALLDESVNQISFGQEPTTLSEKNLYRLKYQFGSVGFTMGSIVGTMLVALPVGFYRMAKESGRSYYHLSQSLLNVGLEEPYFEKGIATDQRTTKIKTLGGLGYLAALVTAGLVPVANILIKFTIVMVATSFAGGVAIYKAINMLYSPRFKPIANNEAAADVDKKLRQLVSTLEHGELPSETTIVEEMALEQGGNFITVKKEPTGRKGASDFVEKAFGFNEDRLSESILYAKVKKNQNGESTHLTESELNVIKEKHHGLFFFTTRMRQKHDTKINNRCDQVNKFVDDYIAGQHQPTPKKEEVHLSMRELINYGR